VIRTVAADCTPPPTWPDSWPCDYCGQPVIRPTAPPYRGDGSIYIRHGLLGAWHEDCRDCLGGPEE
jgi:hypothetical protein